MPTSPPSLIMKARVTLLEPCVHEGKHKVRLAVLSGDSSCFLLSSECERIFSSRSKEFAHLGAIFPLNGVSSYSRVSPRVANRKSEKLYAFVKMAANMEMNSFILNIFIELACSCFFQGRILQRVEVNEM